MNKDLSRIIAELCAKPMEGKELSSQTQRLGDEVKKVFQSDHTLYGKLRGLLESFRSLIPDEKQRYQAALQALSTTSKLNRQEIIKAINGQLEELKILEKGLMPSLPGWREGLRAMEARSQQLRGEIAKLRERIAQLESEEKVILAGMAEREKDAELAEKTIRELFANIGEEITSLNKKVEELTAEGPAAPPVPLAAQPIPPKEPLKSSAPGAKKESGEQTIEIKGSPPPLDTKWQKKCPMCGGQMNLLELENMWQCYTCAHEESIDEVQGKSAPSPTFAEPSASMSSSEYEGSKKGSSLSAEQPSVQRKTCPVCRKKMFWYPKEKAWRCPSCQYERRI